MKTMRQIKRRDPHNRLAVRPGRRILLKLTMWQQLRTSAAEIAGTPSSQIITYTDTFDVAVRWLTEKTTG